MTPKQPTRAITLRLSQIRHNQLLQLAKEFGMSKTDIIRIAIHNLIVEKLKK